jgi:hypothetical protein
VLWWDTNISEVHVASIFQGEVARMAENGRDIGPDWRGAVGIASQEEVQRE